MAARNGTVGRRDAIGPAAAPGASPSSPWRQPVVWLAVAIFAMLLVGCVALLVIAMRVGDAPATTAGDAPTILKVPVERARDSTPAPAR